MKNEKKMSDFFTGIEAVFNPSLSYLGHYPVSIQQLECCSKIENNKNLVSEYLKRKYITNIQELVPVELYNVQLISDENIDTNEGRVLKIWLETITEQVCLDLTGDKPDIPEDVYRTNTQKQPLKAYLKNYKLAISSLLKNENNPELDKYKQNLKNLFAAYLGSNPKNNQYSQDQLFTAFLEKIKQKISGFLVWYDQLIEICKKPIDLKELEQYLDLEKFYFMMAKHLLEINKFMEEDIDGLHNSFIFVDLYVSKLIELKKENNYNMSITMPLFNGTMTKVTTDSLIQEYIELKNRHPEFQTIFIREEQGVNYRDLDVSKTILAQLEEEQNAKKLAVSWKLFKKGEKENKEGNTNTIVTHIKKEEKTIDQKNAELRERLNFFESSPYLYQIEGINHFEGYLGYIYPNNLVIFERFYQNLTTFELADNHATYIMNLNNFIEMSKLSRLEIIKYIKEGNRDVSRKYHTSSWKKKMTAVIEGKGYDIDTIQTIDELIQNHQLEKRGRK